MKTVHHPLPYTQKLCSHEKSSNFSQNGEAITGIYDIILADHTDSAYYSNGDLSCIWVIICSDRYYNVQYANNHHCAHMPHTANMEIQ